MRNFLFVGGNFDGLNVPTASDLDAVQLPKAGAGKHVYHRETLTVADVSVTFYRHESLTPEEVLDRFVEHYKAWCVSRPGSRL